MKSLLFYILLIKTNKVVIPLWNVRVDELIEVLDDLIEKVDNYEEKVKQVYSLL